MADFGPSLKKVAKKIHFDLGSKKWGAENGENFDPGRFLKNFGFLDWGEGREVTPLKYLSCIMGPNNYPAIKN